MASLLAKLFNYVPSTPITTVAPLDADQNQLVGANGALNGGSTDKKLLTRASDASDPPYDLDQLGAGLLARWKQNGVEKIRINNDGSITTGGNITVAKDSPFIVLQDTVGGAGSDFVINFNGGATNIGRSGQSDLLLNNATGVFTFGQIPIIPGYAKLDTHKAAWSVSPWFYPVLPGGVEATESVGRWIVPNGTEIQIIDIVAVWAAGSDSGGSNVFTIKRRNAAGTLQADVGTIDINTPAQNAVHVVTLGAPLTLTAGDQLYPMLTTRNTASEQLVGIGLRGKQKLTT